MASKTVAKKSVVKKRKTKRAFTKGIAHIHSTFNNTIVTITSETGDTISWASSGTVHFKGAKKSTSFAAQVAGESAAKSAYDQGIRELDVNVKGPGPGRESAIRALVSVGMKIISITDTTPVPHNGCRPEKRPRG